MSWLIITLIILFGMFILGLCSDINIFYSNSCNYESAFCRWDNFRKFLELEGFYIDLLKVSLQDNGYEFYYTMRKKS